MIDSAEVKSLIDDHREFMSEWTIDNSVIGMEARYSPWGAYCQAVREMITWRGSVVFHYVAAERDRLRIEECEELLSKATDRSSIPDQRVHLDLIEARHHRADVLHNLRDAGRQFQRHYEIAKAMRVKLGTITDERRHTLEREYRLHCIKWDICVAFMARRTVPHQVFERIAVLPIAERQELLAIARHPEIAEEYIQAQKPLPVPPSSALIDAEVLGRSLCDQYQRD
jgi:hypothetical protein